MQNTKVRDISIEQLARVIGGQNAAPGMAGGRWSAAPNPLNGSTPYTAPGMGFKDVQQGGGMQPRGLNTSPGGGGGGGGQDKSLAPLT